MTSRQDLPPPRRDRRPLQVAVAPVLLVLVAIFGVSGRLGHRAFRREVSAR